MLSRIHSFLNSSHQATQDDLQTEINRANEIVNRANNQHKLAHENFETSIETLIKQTRENVDKRKASCGK